MKNKKTVIILLISIFLLSIIGLVLNYNINTNKIQSFIQNNKYTSAKQQIKLNPMYSKTQVINSIKVKINNKYNISKIEDLSKIADGSWKEMRALKDLLSEINNPVSQDLLKNIDLTLSLEDYKDCVIVYQWYKDDDYEKWNRCWESMSYDIQSFSELKNNLENYSFPEHTSNTKYISDLEKIRLDSINCLDQLIKAYNSRNTSEFEMAGNTLTDLIYDRANIQTEIITACDKMEKIVKNIY